MKPTQKQVIAWAREAGISADAWVSDKTIQDFFALAYEAGRADENEACAKVCEAESSDPAMPESYADNHSDGWADGCDACAAAIRARGEQ